MESILKVYMQIQFLLFLGLLSKSKTEKLWRNAVSVLLNLLLKLQVVVALWMATKLFLLNLELYQSIRLDLS